MSFKNQFFRVLKERYDPRANPYLPSILPPHAPQKINCNESSRRALLKLLNGYNFSQFSCTALPRKMIKKVIRSESYDINLVIKNFSLVGYMSFDCCCGGGLPFYLTYEVLQFISCGACSLLFSLVPDLTCIDQAEIFYLGIGFPLF